MMTNFELTCFSRNVKRAANQTEQSAWFYDRCFLRPIFEAMDTKMNWQAFSKALDLASRAGLLRLHRADLVEAMDPKMVASSRVHHAVGEWHFLEE